MDGYEAKGFIGLMPKSPPDSNKLIKGFVEQLASENSSIRPIFGFFLTNKPGYFGELTIGGSDQESYAKPGSEYFTVPLNQNPY